MTISLYSYGMTSIIRLLNLKNQQWNMFTVQYFPWKKGERPEGLHFVEVGGGNYK